MTATEAKYHKNYLTNMCNKYKVKQKNEAVEKETIIKYRRYLYPIFKFMYTWKVANRKSSCFQNSLSRWFKTRLKILCPLWYVGGMRCRFTLFGYITRWQSVMKKKKFCLLISLKIIAAITCNYLIINYVNRNYDTVV